MPTISHACNSFSRQSGTVIISNICICKDFLMKREVLTNAFWQSQCAWKCIHIHQDMIDFICTDSRGVNEYEILCTLFTQIMHSRQNHQ